MFIGTHAAVPVILAGVVNVAVYGTSGRLLLRTRHLAAVAVGGVLPDVVWPHLSLHARLTSWSHTVWFIAAILLLLVVLGRRFLQPNWQAGVLAAWLAVVLHVAIDTISGGTSPLYPLGGRIGVSTLRFHYWILVDLLTVPLAILVFMWTHRRASAADARSSGATARAGSQAENSARSGRTSPGETLPSAVRPPAPRPD